MGIPPESMRLSIGRRVVGIITKDRKKGGRNNNSKSGYY